MTRLKILIIDYCCNSVDLAWRLSHQEAEIEHIYLMADNICPTIWQNKNLTLLPSVADIHLILALVRSLKVALVANFSPLLGMSGLLELLAAQGVKSLGSNRIFSETEIKKRDFKKWLIDNKFSTPQVQFEGMMVDVLSHAKQLAYPLVIKPDIQVGPPVITLHNSQQLKQYFALIKSQHAAAEHSVIFMLEQEVLSAEVIQFHYLMVAGRAKLTHSINVLYGSKCDENQLGAMVAVSPWSQLANFKNEVERLLNLLAATGAAAIGTLQCMVDSDGILHVLENNARPAACNVYDDWDDLLGFILAMADDDFSELNANDFFISQRRPYSIGVPLIHQSPKIEIADDNFDQLRDLGVAPYAFTKANSYISAHDSMPSLMIVGGESPSKALEAFNDRFSLVTDWLAYDAVIINEDIFL